VTSGAKRAVVLAAGRGSRLGAMTDDLPKCLAIIAGRPLLDWLLDALLGAGIERVLIVAGYRHEALARYASERVEIVPNLDWAGSNMLGTLRCAHPWLAAHPCVISYSDIAVRSEHVARLSVAHGDIVIANNLEWRSLWQARFSDPLADVETFTAADGLLSAIGGRAQSLDEIEGQFMGLLKTTPTGWAQLDAILAKDPNMAVTGDTTKLLSRALSEQVSVRVVDCEGGWIEIDSAMDAQVVAAAVARERWPHDWRG
jgi:L-glutamine-phosphate cytidylyltransferase